MGVSLVGLISRGVYRFLAPAQSVRSAFDPHCYRTVSRAPAATVHPVGTDYRSTVWGALLGLALAAPVDAQISVSSGGQASTGLPIAVPPGISGMAPNLSLNYADGGVNGPVGVGWSVQGISTITRCPSNRQVDFAYRNVVFDKDDKLCLDGQRLIQTDATGAVSPSAQAVTPGGPLRLNQLDDALGVAASQTREYRTEKDSYSRIRAYGTAHTDATKGPATFVVWTKSGLKYEYGRVEVKDTAGVAFEPDNALIRVQGRDEVAVWAVRRISDVSGNFMEFRYTVRDVPWGSATGTTPAQGREWRLDQVRYTGKVDSANQTTQAPTNVVVFEYVDREVTASPKHDRSEAYQWNNKNVSIWLLKTISTHVGVAQGAATGILVKQYRLDYTRSVVSGRSLLGSFRECSSSMPTGSARCLPPTTFTYRQTSAPSFGAADIGSLRHEQMLDHVNGNAGIVTGDFNGDGMTDVLRYHDDPSNNRLFLSVGSGAFGPGQSSNLGGVQLSHSNGCQSVDALDVNGDGFTDLLRRTGEGCGSAGNLLLLNARDGSFSSIALPSDIRLVRRASNYTSSSTACVAQNRSVLPLSRPTSAKTDPAPVDEYFGDAGVPPESAQTTPAAASMSGLCQKYVTTQGLQYYLVDVDADGLLDIVTTELPALTWYSNWGPQPSMTVRCIEIGGCTKVYRQSASGTFAPLATLNTNNSLYRTPGPDRWNPNPYWQRPELADINGDGLMDILADLGNWRSLGNGSFAQSAIQNSTQLCALPIDFNGDGRNDCLKPAEGGTQLTMSFGATQSAVTNFNLTGADDRLYAVNGSGAQITGAVVEDFDGDGRQDILRYSEDNWRNGIYLSLGDGTFAPRVQAQLGNVRLQSSDGSRAFVLGDFLGDGTLQILRLASNPPSSMSAPTATVACMSSGCYEPPPEPPAGIVDTPYNMLFVRTGTSGPVDVLESVKSSSGLTSKVLSWRSLSRGTDPDGAGYLAESGPPVPDILGTTAVVNVTSPMYVITRTERETANGQKLTTRYRYEGLKAERGGRGMLGFRRMLQEDTTPAGTPMTVVTEYLQRHPYIGVASRTQSFLRALNASGGTSLSSTENTYCEWSVAAGQSSATPDAPCNAPNAFVSRPYLARTVERGTDLSGAPLPEVDTTTEYNQFGDPTKITVVTRRAPGDTSLPFTKVTNNLFCPPNATTCEGIAGTSPNLTSGDNWILGRLSRTTVQSSSPSAMLSASAGTAAMATATKGAPPPGTPMAINPAVLQSIINLVLED